MKMTVDRLAPPTAGAGAPPTPPAAGRARPLSEAGSPRACLAARLAAAVAAVALAWPVAVGAQAKLSEHVRKDIERHKAMAAAHAAAATCLESGKDEKTCQAELQVQCKGLAIGKYCGMRHEH